MERCMRCKKNYKNAYPIDPLDICDKDNTDMFSPPCSSNKINCCRSSHDILSLNNIKVELYSFVDAYSIFDIWH